MTSLNDIFKKWIEITEISPDCNIFNSRNFDVYGYNERIKELLRYNGNELDAVILINSFLENYMKSRSVSMFDIYIKNEALENKINQMREMKKLIDSFEIEDYYSEQIESYKKALANYDINKDSVNELLNNKEDITLLKVNALYAYEALKPMQFKKGDFSENVPKYSKTIYAFNDINVLLNTIMNDDNFNGITLNAIIDNETFEYSYFVFAIKNGQNVYLMGDLPKSNYPGQKYNRRTPGRQMEQRINMFNFPYELLALKGDRYNITSEKTALVEHSNYSILGTISDCNEYSIIWLINMMAIIKEKFFDNKMQTDNLYYTGAMIDMVGIEKKEYAVAVTNSYNILEMEKINKKKAVEVKLDYSRESRGETSWIVDRYMDQISEEILGGISENDFTELSEETALSIVGEKNVARLNENITTIGTKEDFEYRQAWLARYNLAKAVNILFEKEVKDSLSDLQKWYKSALTSNIDKILEASAMSEFVTEEIDYREFTQQGLEKYLKGEKISDSCMDNDVVTFGRGINIRQHNVVTTEVFDGDDSTWQLSGKTVLCGKNTKNLTYGWRYGCYVYNNKPAVVVKFKITSPKAIADICGLNIDELPELLRNYCPTKEFSAGNHLLYNIDPMDWVIENHMYEFDADVAILLSKKAYNELRKKHGLEANKIWEEKKD